MVDGRLSIEGMARTTIGSLADHNPSYVRLPLGWPGSCCRFADPLDYIGFDGGGGIGSGPGMTVGAALALRDTDRLPVAILGDGDYLMGVTALWTAVRYRVPLLILVSNNESFFNDELHQERVARVRGRPVENRSIGLRMNDPPLDLAMLARGQGAVGLGPVRTPAELASAIADWNAGNPIRQGMCDRRACRSRVCARRVIEPAASDSGAVVGSRIEERGMSPSAIIRTELEAR